MTQDINVVPVVPSVFGLVVTLVLFQLSKLLQGDIYFLKCIDGIIYGSIIGVINGDTRSLDYSSCDGEKYRALVLPTYSTSCGDARLVLGCMPIWGFLNGGGS